MANLNESDLWETGIYQLEEDDPVLGGPTGIDNMAPRQLASRTRYQRLRNVTPWDATLTYPANVAYVSYDGTTWKSVGESLNVTPGTDAGKWVRWGFTLAELNASLGDAVAAHEAKPDPHPQYATDADLAAHVAASNPHAQYATDADLAAHIADANPHPQYATDADLAAHTAAANPHAQYVRHDAAQGLTAAQALQARANIDAPQMSQIAGVVGSVRNLRCNCGGGKVATFTADEIIVETQLGGMRYCLANFNKTIDLAKVGAGGMDVGVANNGFTAVYAIYNPVANVWDTLGVDSSAVVAPQVYGGNKMPAGFTASALISVVGTQTAAGFGAFSQIDRSIDSQQVLSQSTNVSTGTPSGWLVNTIPKNAIECRGSVGYSCSVTSQGGTSVFGNAAGVGPAGTNLVVNAGSTVIIPFSGIVMTTPQTLWYSGTSGGGTPTYQVFVSGYKF